MTGINVQLGKPHRFFRRLVCGSWVGFDSEEYGVNLLCGNFGERNGSRKKVQTQSIPRSSVNLLGNP